MRVAILVLVDFPLQLYISLPIKNTIVLVAILVLVDFPLQYREVVIMRKQYKVAILVLVDFPLQWR